MLGHNRWATQGAISKQNAHPFEFENVVGVHNGTLKTVYQLDNYKDFEVDSENLYHHMDKNGVDDTIECLNGAFALVFYDKKEHKLQMVRNNERPLFYVFNKEHDLLLWASEVWMLHVACAQMHIDIEKPIELPVGMLYTFDIPFGYVSKKFEKTSIRKVELYKPPVFVRPTVTVTQQTSKTVVPFKVKQSALEYQKHLNKFVTFSVGKAAISSSNQDFIECWLTDNEDVCVRVFAVKGSEQWDKMLSSTNYFKAFVRSWSTLENNYLTVDMRTLEEVPVVADDEAPEMVEGFEKELIDEVEFNRRSYKGCAWCSSPVSFREAEEVVWIAKTECICPDCSVQPEVVRYLN